MIRSHKRISCGNKIEKNYNNLDDAGSQIGYLDFLMLKAKRERERV